MSKKNIGDFFYSVSGGKPTINFIWMIGTIQHILLIFNSDGYLKFLGTFEILGVILALIAVTAAIYSFIALICFPFWLLKKD